MKLNEVLKEDLLKIIELQSCIIQGRDIRAVLRKYMSIFRSKTSADIIAVCLKDEEQVNIKYILEEKRLFVHLIRKYMPDRKSLKWNEFVTHCEAAMPQDEKEFHKINSFHEIFKGFLPSKISKQITENIGMKQTYIIPMFTQNNKERFGFVFYMYESEEPVEVDVLKEATLIFETILQPLYDRHHYTLYSKCVRINNTMSRLTQQEKRIVKKVMEGHSYPDTAKELSVSINTVKTHMKNVFNKFGVNSKIELFKKINIETNAPK